MHRLVPRGWVLQLSLNCGVRPVICV
jgi:hypothetical protein